MPGCQHRERAPPHHLALWYVFTSDNHSNIRLLWLFVSSYLEAASNMFTWSSKVWGHEWPWMAIPSPLQSLNIPEKHTEAILFSWDIYSPTVQLDSPGPMLCIPDALFIALRQGVRGNLCYCSVVTTLQHLTIHMNSPTDRIHWRTPPIYSHLLPPTLAAPRSRNSSRGICARAIACVSELLSNWAMA